MQVGDRVGIYEVREHIANGGMAEVWKVWNTGLRRFEAMKVPFAHYTHDPAFVDRFLRGARIEAQLIHPHIAPVYAISDNNAPCQFFTMEYIPGSDLSDLLEGPRLEAAQACEILRAFADALDFAHAKGVVHRDVKPSNVLLLRRDDGTGYVPKVVDFGIARAAEEANGHHTNTGMVIGSPPYMSPEQANGDALDYRTDIYSLGVVAYEMLCGVTPFRQSEGTGPFSVLIKHMNEAPPEPMLFNATMPPRASKVLLQALAKNPSDRPRSCRVFVDDLHAALLVKPSPTKPSRRFQPTLPVLVLVPLCLGAALITWSMKSSAPPPLHRSEPMPKKQIDTQPPLSSAQSQAIGLAQKAEDIIDSVGAKTEELFQRLGSKAITKDEFYREIGAVTTQFETALRLAVSAVSADVNNENAHLQRCRALFYLRRFSEAWQFIQQAKARFPRSIKFDIIEQRVKAELKPSSPLKMESSV
jgi:serine/threonine-protein kinase